ncbi:MAG: GNAT family N-acetyltransferase [Gammaproteobacteria bacterium]
MSRIIAFPALSVATPQPDDLQAIAGLVHRVWHQGYDRFLPAAQCAERSPALFRELIAQRLPQASIARLGDRIVGYCDHVANCIDGVWVEERYRRRGIGARLLDDQLGRLRATGMPSAQAGCETFNAAAVGFFNKQGWYVLDETVEQLADDTNIAIIVFGHSL